MKFQQSLISLFVIGTLSACGGSSSSSDDGIETTTLSGKAADGYLVNANVCLDLNLDKVCGDDEPMAVTTDGGAFTLEGVTQAQIDENPLLVEIIVDVTLDEDDGGETIKQSYTLSAPAGYTFVSPLTTLVQNEVENGSSVEDAEEDVQEKLGTTLELDEDYVAGKASGDDAQEFEKLHQIAQVTANIIADNMELLEDAAEDEDIELSELISLITNEVFDALTSITSKIDEIAGDDDLEFDADDIAEEVDEDIDLDEETLADKIDKNNAEKDAVVANLVEIIQDGGLNWFWSEEEDDYVLLEYGTLSLDSTGELSDLEYELDENGDEQMLSFGAEEGRYILAADGWVVDDDTITDITLNTDKSITFVMATAALNETVTGNELILDSLNVKTVLQDTGGDGLWAETVSETLEFPDNSKAYQLEFKQTSGVSAYELELGDWCEYDESDQWSELNESCNAIYLSEGWATTLAAFLEEGSSFSIAHNVSAQLMSDGSVELYQGETQLDSGTWSDITVHSTTLREITIPISVTNQDIDFWYVDDDQNTLYLAVYEDFVRFVSMDDDDGDDELIFNSVARDYILDNADRDMLSDDSDDSTSGTGATGSGSTDDGTGA
jgi:hypothetical protein